MFVTAPSDTLWHIDSAIALAPDTVAYLPMTQSVHSLLPDAAHLPSAQTQHWDDLPTRRYRYRVPCGRLIKATGFR